MKVKLSLTITGMRENTCSKSQMSKRKKSSNKTLFTRMGKRPNESQSARTSTPRIWWNFLVGRCQTSTMKRQSSGSWFAEWTRECWKWFTKSTRWRSCLGQARWKTSWLTHCSFTSTEPACQTHFCVVAWSASGRWRNKRSIRRRKNKWVRKRSRRCHKRRRNWLERIDIFVC